MCSGRSKDLKFYNTQEICNSLKGVNVDGFISSKIALSRRVLPFAILKQRTSPRELLKHSAMF